MPKTRILPADLKLSSSLDALSGVAKKTSYHLALGADDNNNGDGVGIAFSRSSAQSNIGAAIIFERTGANSKGELQFYTKVSDAPGDDPIKALSITSNSEVVKHVQPAFNVYLASDSSTSFIPDGSWATIQFTGEVFDVGSNFSSYTFTAPVTGKYLLTTWVRINDLSSTANYYWLRISTSNRNYYGTLFDANDLDNGFDIEFHTFNLVVVADMDANDTATVDLSRQLGAATAHVQGNGAAATIYTMFHGYLLG